MTRMRESLTKCDWSELSGEESAHKKADKLQKLLVSKYEEYFPEKVRITSSDDQPFINEKLKKMKRKKCREYQKHRRSSKWKSLEIKYKEELEKTKKGYYRKKIRDLRKLKPKNWHKEIKKLTSYDQLKSEEIIVEAIKDLPIQEQAEKIADSFASVSQEYERLETEDIKIPYFTNDEIPQFEEKDILEVLASLDASKSNVVGDIPAKVLKSCSAELTIPVTDLINTSIRQGKWPDIFKVEIVTPVPKEFPPKDIDQLRNVSGLLNLDKVAEKLVSRANARNFLKNGVEPSLIPLLDN